MKFTKMQGAGNDFVIINNMTEKIPFQEMGSIAKKICARRISVGADGVMFVEKPEHDADYRMLFFNADGSMGEMCGNGARCIARYGYENGLAGEQICIETTAGPVYARRESRQIYTIRMNDITQLDIGNTAVFQRKSYPYAYVELGSPGLPHVVVPIPGLSDTDPESLRSLGMFFRYHEKFPKGANVNFYDITGPNELQELTYERGVEDFTFACGTGTCATAAVLTLQKQISGKDVKVHVPGGLLTVSLTALEDHVENIYLTGPTLIVAEGDLIEALDC
ncbi:MAG: diaminopimelate epimerase [Lachnospiraceae bacterium]|nr:diaminopimelate epimerase [Lachnospiraceae bacterium]